jgi:hypothetical protein
VTEALRVALRATSSAVASKGLMRVKVNAIGTAVDLPMEKVFRTLRICACAYRAVPAMIAERFKPPSGVAMCSQVRFQRTAEIWMRAEPNRLRRFRPISDIGCALRQWFLMPGLTRIKVLV